MQEERNHVQVIKKINFEDHRETFEKGVFIYPTDTIYGLGCNALNPELIDKIRNIKERDERPLSIIAPNVEFIKENFVVSEEELSLLPGPYTLLLKRKDPDFLKEVSNNDRIGVRIPDHEFTKKLQELGIPIITTSVNLSGEKPACSISDIPEKILGNVDLVIDWGTLSSTPSTLILDGKKMERK